MLHQAVKVAPCLLLRNGNLDSATEAAIHQECAALAINQSWQHAWNDTGSTLTLK